MQRIHDHLLLEEEFVENQERLRKAKAANTAAPSAAIESEAMDRNADERSRVDDMRGSPMGVGNLEEMIDDDHAIVSSATGPEYYVSIMSFVDKDLLEPGASILLHHKSVSVVGVLTDDADPLVSVMKLDKAPRSHMQTSVAWNSKYKKSGKLWSCRFYIRSSTKRWA
jgi:26S proteasome regulatory subunit T2